MAYDVTATFQEEAIKVEGTTSLDLYCMNASYSGWDPHYYVNYNQDVYCYQINSTDFTIKSTEQKYTGLPITRESVQSNIQGEIAGLNISVPNTDRAVESLIQDYNYLRGCDVHVIFFFAKHLPSGSAAEYIGTDADHNAGMAETFYVDSTTSNQEVVTFNCRSKFDIKSIVVPGRRFSRECNWDFSSTGNCNASATQVASWTTCDKTVVECRKRHNEARFGGFPSIPARGYIIIR